MPSTEELNTLFNEFPLWVKTVDPNKTYDYSDPANCAFAQYLHAMGYSEALVNSSHIRFNGFGDMVVRYPDWIGMAVLLPIGYDHINPRTFGMLAKTLAVHSQQVPVTEGPLVAGNL